MHATVLSLSSLLDTPILTMIISVPMKKMKLLEDRSDGRKDVLLPSIWAI